MSTQQADKIRENRLRRMAARQRLRLQKSPRRDQLAWDYGTYQLVDADTGSMVAYAFETGRGYGLSLDQIEAWLTAPEHDHDQGEDSR
jgi:hypothetical protein